MELEWHFKPSIKKSKSPLELSC